MAKLSNIEHYETPRWMIDCLLKACPEILDKQIAIDPCCGENRAITHALKSEGLTVVTNDSHFQAYLNRDIREEKTWDEFLEITEGSPGVAVVMNPPFSIASKVWEYSCKKGFYTAMLGRVTLPEMVRGDSDRCNVWQKYIETVRVEIPRYSYRQNQRGRWQSDSAPHIWYVYDPRQANDGGWCQIRRFSVLGIPNHKPHP